MSPLFFTKPQFVQVPKGITIREIVDLMYEKNSIPLNERGYRDILVEVDGIPISFDKWDRVPSVDQHVLVSFLLHGGGSGNTQKDIGRAMMMLAVVVLSIMSGQVYGPQLASSLFAAQAGSALAVTTSAVVSMAVATAGMMLVNALVPLPKVHDPSSGRDKASYGITGASNQANPFGTIPVILGTHKMFPLYGSYPYTEVVGNDEYLRSLFVYGYGPATITEIEIGETPISLYTNVDMEVREGRSTDAAITLVPDTVLQKSIQERLKTDDPPIIKKVDGDGWNELGVNIIFPQGIYDEGATSQMDVIVEAWYKTEEETEWTHVPGVYPDTCNKADQTNHTFYWKTKSTKPIRLGTTWTVDPSKQYYVKVQKTWNKAIYEDKPNYAQYCNWEYLKAFAHVPPVNFSQSLAMMGLKIKATEQLNGVISELSSIVSSYATIWDGSSWTGEAISNNPAALFRMVLMHPANVKARIETQIDDEGLGDWYTFCEDNGYAFNQIRDSKSSVWECLAEIAAAGRAAPTLVDGVWGVVVDRSDKEVVQHITPRNSWGFSSSKKLYDPPHGFRVKFKNELNDYEDDERIVLDDDYQLDGYDAFDNFVGTATVTGATIFESVEFPGITHPELVFKFARYFMAAARLRPEVYTLNMDFEHLVCKRGDKVLVAHDVPMWGTKWGRIKAIVSEQTLINSSGTGVFYDQSGNAITWESTDYTSWDEGDTTAKIVGIQLDEKFAITSPAQYVMRIRRGDTGVSQLINLAYMAVGEYDIAILETALEVGDPIIPEVGDLVIIGELTKETNECLVKAIHAENDLNARLELVDFAAAIYDADVGEIPEFNTNITKQPELTEMIPAVPSIYSIQSGTETMEIGAAGRLAPRMFVTCVVGETSSRVGSFEVRYRLYGDLKWAYATCKAQDPTAICTDVIEGETYEVAARSVSPYGVYSDWSSIQTHLIIGQSELPDDVTRFTCNILGTEAHLSWEPVSDLDLSHYRVRWSPLTASAVWEDAIDIIVKVAKPASSVSAPAMTGSYLIKAVDYKGFESENAAIALSSVTRIPGYTNAQTLTQPAWSGTGDGAEYDAVLDGIILSYTTTGDNLIANGEDFTGSTLDGWNFQHCTGLAVDGGYKGNKCLQITRTDSATQTAYYPIVTEEGKSYIAKVKVKSGVNGEESAGFVIEDGVTILATSGTITTTDDWVTYTLLFRATGETTNVNCQRAVDAAGTMLFDEVECYENLVANGEDWVGGDSNCVALYDFEDGELFTDGKSTNTLLASTSTPTVCTTDYIVGAACADFELDSSQYFYVTDTNLSSDFPFKSGTTNNKISIAAWIKPESFATGSNINTIVSKYDTGSNRRSFTLRVYEETAEDNRLELVIGYNNGLSYEKLQHEYGLITNTWYHVTATFDNDDMSYSLRLKSENGTTLGSDIEATALHTISFTTESFRIGAQFNAGSLYAGSRFDGLIDDVIIFKDIISKAESERIALGTYDAGGDLTGWTTSNCNATSVAGGVSGNCLQIERTGGDEQSVYQVLYNLNIGQTYRLTASVKEGTSVGDTFRLIAYDYINDTSEYLQGTATDAWVEHSFDFIATNDTLSIYLRKESNVAGTMLFDGVTFEEVELLDEGTYALSDVIDLEGVYTARISASLTTTATNLFDNLYEYGNLYNVTNLYGVDTGQCGVNLEVRTTSDDPDATPTWSDWKQVIVGDFTARAFQFRLRFWTNDTDITPILTAISIYADLADRTEGFTQEINATKETVTFAFPFYATPSLSLSLVDNTTTGTFYILSDQTRTNFSVDVKNSGGTSITKTITGVAKGYGLQEV